MTKFVAVKFKEEDTRTYTYAWSGDELFPGDRVKVPDNRSDGWKRVTVVAFDVGEPSFACKAILGRVEDVPAPEPLPLDPDRLREDREERRAIDRDDDPLARLIGGK